MSQPRMSPMDTGFQVGHLLKTARAASFGTEERVTRLSQSAREDSRRIILMPGEELPFRRNPALCKRWQVESGLAHADVNETDMALMPGAEVVISPGALHQIENRGSAPLVLREDRTRVPDGSVPSPVPAAQSLTEAFCAALTA